MGDLQQQNLSYILQQDGGKIILTPSGTQSGTDSDRAITFSDSPVGMLTPLPVGTAEYETFTVPQFTFTGPVSSVNTISWYYRNEDGTVAASPQVISYWGLSAANYVGGLGTLTDYQVIPLWNVFGINGTIVNATPCFNFAGVSVNHMLPNPTPTSAPILTNISALEYANVGQSYDCIVSFITDEYNPSWLYGLNLYVVAHGQQAPTSATPIYSQITPANAAGQYTADFQGLTYGVSYDLYCAYLDNAGNTQGFAASYISTTNPTPFNSVFSFPSGTSIFAQGTTSAPTPTGQSQYGTAVTVTPTITTSENWNVWGQALMLGCWANGTGSINTSITSPSQYQAINPTLVATPQNWASIFSAATGTQTGATINTNILLPDANAYQIAMWAVDENGNTTNAYPFTLGQGIWLGGSTPPPGTNANGNLVVDSNFDFANWNTSGFGGSDPYWNFAWIDELSFFIGRGSVNNTLGIQNYLGVRPGDSNRHCVAQSEVITVVPGVQYTISGYIDASTCSGSNQPYLAATATNGADVGVTNSLVYAYAQQSIGSKGLVSATFTCPPGVNQMTFVFNSAGCKVNSSILVFSIPMFCVGTSVAYVPDAPAVQPQAIVAPATQTSDGGTFTGTGAARTSGLPGTIDHLTASQQTQGVIANTIGGDGLYMNSSQVNTRHIINNAIRPIHLQGSTSNITSSEIFNAQGSLLNIQGVPKITYSWNGTGTQVQLSTSSTTLGLTNGTTISVGSWNQTFTGLTNGDDYWFDVWYNISGAAIGANIYTSQPTTAQQQADCFVDGVIAFVADWQLLATNSGTGNGTGGGGSGIGWSCPATYQVIYTKEKGYIRADEMDIGMHLRGVNHPWVRITELVKLPAPIWSYTVQWHGHLEAPCSTTETFYVNDTHAVRNIAYEWLMVKNMKPGDLLLGKDSELKVTDAHYIGEGYFIGIECETHEFLMGETLAHNFFTEN